MNIESIPQTIINQFHRGTVIPAMPLALNKDRQFDSLHQRTLLRYYIDAGVGGIAVGVHSTQFEIRSPEINLFKPVLQFASQEIDEWSAYRKVGILKIAGICGDTDQAIDEAEFSAEAGYHAGLVSLASLVDKSIDAQIRHCMAIAEKIPIIGFYLQPAVGGSLLPYSFWRKFAEIKNVIGIKIAAFNRYQTLDVVRALADSGMEEKISLYTGNDDNIVVDLLTPYQINTSKGLKTIKFKGGLLGHWGVWTKAAVELFQELRQIREKGDLIPLTLLTKAVQVTDMNAALFDAANNFSGCIPGIHEVLVKERIFEGNWCLNKQEILSEGQNEELERVIKAYPHLCDRLFIEKHLNEWLVNL